MLRKQVEGQSGSSASFERYFVNLQARDIPGGPTRKEAIRDYKHPFRSMSSLLI